jgi:tetrathionate reductase subunit B
MHQQNTSHTNDTSARRSFLKKLGAAVGTATVASALPTTTDAAVSKQAVQYGMLIDTRRCIGCHSCTVACKAEYDVPLGSNRSWVEYVEKGDYPNVSRDFLPRLCNHCSTPSCVSVCPTVPKATYQREEDGIVVVDPELCIRCTACVQACPYEARFMNPVTGVADKCDFCVHRVSQGLSPACVETCIGGARIFGDLNDPDSEISRLIAANTVSALRPEIGTKPNVFYIAADHSDERGANEYLRVTTHRKYEERG